MKDYSSTIKKQIADIRKQLAAVESLDVDDVDQMDAELIELRNLAAEACRTVRDEINGH